MGTLKYYLSKIIFAAFCFLTLGYNQCGYAGFEKNIARDEITGREYPFMGMSEIVVTQEAAKKITDTLLHKNKKMWWLMLQKVSFEPEAFYSIVRALQTDQTLERISLLRNIYAPTDYLMIAEIFQTVKTIKNLVIVGELDKIYEANIIEALIHGNVTEIKLIQAIGDNGAEALSRLLDNNKELHYLYLCGNNFTLAGIRAIAHGLSENLGLQELIFECDNAFDDEAAIMIAEALRRNRVLKIFKYKNNPRLTSRGHLTITEALCHNSTILVIETDAHYTGQRPGYLLIQEFIMERNKLIKQISRKIGDLTRKANLALLLGTHPRIGIDSPLTILDGYLLREILTNYRENELDIIMNATELQLQQFTVEEREVIVRVRELQEHITRAMRSPINEPILEERQQQVQAPTEILERNTDVAVTDGREDGPTNITLNITMTNTTADTIVQPLGTAPPSVIFSSH